MELMAAKCCLVYEAMGFGQHCPNHTPKEKPPHGGFFTPTAARGQGAKPPLRGGQTNSLLDVIGLGDTKVD